MKKKNHGNSGRKRINGTGTLERQGNTYIARWYILGEDGKKRRISKSTGTDDLTEARRFLNQMTRELNLDQRERMLDTIANAKLGIEKSREQLEMEKSLKPAMLLEDAFDAYIASPDRRDASTRTLDGYEAQFTTFLRWMREHNPTIQEMRHVTKFHADNFVRELAKDHSANTFNKYLTFFKCLWATLE